MTSPSNLGSLADKSSPDYLMRRLAALEAKVRQLETARTLEAATIGEGGLTVKDGGAIIVLDQNGNVVAKLGTLSNGIGIGAWRTDGSIAWQVFAGFVGIYDRSGNYVVTDDTTSGQGLARPYVPFGSFADNTVPTSTTTSSTFTTVQTLVGYKQHPKITAQILTRASDSSTAGEARLIDQSGTQVGPTITIPAGDFSYHSLPASTLAGAHLTPISLNLQVRRTAGTGTIGARGVSAWGVESAAS